MSDYQKALNEVSSLFVQTGIPPGQAQDITQRLSVALSSYFDYRAGISSGATTSSESGNTNPSFLNQFRVREAGLPTTQAGRAGKDGLNGWGFGADGAAGTAGTDGQSGQQGESGTSGRDGRDGSGVDIDLKKKIDELKDRLYELQKKVDGKSGCPTCCKGKFYGQDACSVLEQQANELKKIKRKLGLPVEPDPDEPDINDIDDRLKAVEDAIADAVDCP